MRTTIRRQCVAFLPSISAYGVGMVGSCWRRIAACISSEDAPWCLGANSKNVALFSEANGGRRAARENETL
jgi:hypothetical protein